MAVYILVATNLAHYWRHYYSLWCHTGGWHDLQYLGEMVFVTLVCLTTFYQWMKNLKEKKCQS